MDLLIKILGYAMLAGLVLLALVGAFIAWKWRALKAALRSGGASSTPQRIQLVEDGDPSWSSDEAGTKMKADLERLGYRAVRHYLVDGIPGVRLVAYHHERAGVYAVYYDHPAAGRWCDLSADLVDGLEITVSNAPQGEQLDRRPGTEKHTLKGKTFPELHRLMSERLSGATVVSRKAEDFANVFESAYAKDMDWRAGRNGISFEEFKRVAETTEHGLAPEQWARAFDETKRQELHAWEADALEQFVKVTALPVADWKKFEDRMLIYRDDFHAHAYLLYLADTLGLEDEQVAKYRDELTNGLSLRGLLQKLGEEFKVTWRDLGPVATPRVLTIIGYEQASSDASDDNRKDRVVTV